MPCELWGFLLYPLWFTLIFLSNPFGWFFLPSGSFLAHMRSSVLHFSHLQCSVQFYYLVHCPAKASHPGLPGPLARFSHLREPARLRLSSPCPWVPHVWLKNCLQVVNGDDPSLLHWFSISQGSPLSQPLQYRFCSICSGRLDLESWPKRFCVCDLRTKQNIFA